MIWLNKIDIIISHKNCQDGTGCVKIAQRFNAAMGYDKPEVVLLSYGKDGYFDTDRAEGKNVIIADYSFDRRTTEHLHEVTNNLLIVDHHVTAKGILKGLDYTIFDMDKCGASLLWSTLFPKEEVPAIIGYIEDRDLWKHRLEDTDHVSYGLRLCPQHELVKLTPETFFADEWLNSLKHNGGVVEISNKAYVAGKVSIDISKNWRYATINGVMGVVINNTHLLSETGNAACVSYGVNYTINYFITPKEIVFSLRSLGNFDVAELAATLGGGGHTNAAGCSIPIEEFDFGKFFGAGVIARKDAKDD